MATTTKTNLFAAAAKKETVKPKSTDKKKVIITEEEHQGISRKIDKLATLRNRMKADETEAGQLEQDIKGVGVQKLLSLYQEEKKRPDSFIIKGENSESSGFLLLVIDKYAGVPDDARATELRTLYGEDIVTTVKDYLFNQTLLLKHMEAISDALLSCNEIPDEDKGLLIQMTEKHSVTKGAIERLMQYPTDAQGGFLFNLQPQVQLKVVGQG